MTTEWRSFYSGDKDDKPFEVVCEKRKFSSGDYAIVYERVVSANTPNRCEAQLEIRPIRVEFRGIERVWPERLYLPRYEWWDVSDYADCLGDFMKALIRTKQDLDTLDKAFDEINKKRTEEKTRKILEMILEGFKNASH